MNVFYLDKQPTDCARFHVDKHVVKMNVEYAQLLSTAHRVLDGELWYDKTANGRSIKRWRHTDQWRDDILYKASHVNHPSNIWCRASKDNYDWLYQLFLATLDEYTYRYGKVHGCAKMVHVLRDAPQNIPDVGFTQPTPAMPDQYKTSDAIQAYRQYYIGEKSGFAVWKNRETPAWFLEENYKKVLDNAENPAIIR